MISAANMIGQNADSIIVSSGCPSIIYPLINDKNTEQLKKTGVDCHFIYPLLIVNYCCPVKLKKTKSSCSKPFIIGLRGFIFKK